MQRFIGHGFRQNNKVIGGGKAPNQKLFSWVLRRESSNAPKIEVSNRLSNLRKQLDEDDANFGPFSQAAAIASSEDKYSSDNFSDKAKEYLTQVNVHFNKQYSRGGAHGEGFVGVQEVLEKAPFANAEKQAKLLKLGPDIQQQMRVKVSEAYVNHALDNLPENAVEPSPILKVIAPDELEVLYRDVGETDPSNQNKYSPMAGLLHKYNMLLAMTSINCSSHCRYCYRSDLFNGSSGKSKADLVAVATYVKAYNRMIEDAIVRDDSKWDKATGNHVLGHGEPLMPLREILLSGGDPMTLPNSTLARYLVLMAESGIRTVRFGSKEIAFNPNRFDDAFWSTLDLFHENYPEVRVELVGHYVHPYELVKPQTDEDGQYVYDTGRDYVVHDDVQAALDQINARRSWFGHFNQFPIIAGVNDSPDIMRLLLHLTNKCGITMHNVYACREIVGNPHFRGDLTIPKQYDLLEAAKIGLSGLENHARLIMSTEQGKMDVMGYKEDKVYLRLNRFVHGRKPDNTMIIVDRSKMDGAEFYWLSQDVIDVAVDEAGRRMVTEEADHETRFIKSLKAAAAKEVQDGIEASLPEEAFTAEAADESQEIVTIEIINTDSTLVDTIQRAPEDNETVAEMMMKNGGHVEMVCGGKLSCTTCVGKVVADYELPEATLDETDATDTLNVNLEEGELRACCQIRAKPGKSYQFTLI